MTDPDTEFEAEAGIGSPPPWASAATADGGQAVICLTCGGIYSADNRWRARRGLCRTCFGAHGFQQPEDAAALARAMIAVGWRIQGAAESKDWYTMAKLLDYANRLASYDAETFASEHAYVEVDVLPTETSLL